MTVLSDYSPAVGLGNGVTTVFPCGWRCLDSSHLIVTKYIDIAGAATPVVFTEDVDYTVQNAGTADDAQVTLTGALAFGDGLRIERETSLLQEVDLRPQGPYEADTIEEMFDRRAMIDQEQDYRLGVLESLGDLVTVTDLANAVAVNHNFTTDADSGQATFPFDVACAGGEGAQHFLLRCVPRDGVNDPEADPFSSPPVVIAVAGGSADVITIQAVSGLSPGFTYKILGLVLL